MTTPKGMKVWRGQVRIPTPLFELVKQRATTNYRSINAELVEIIREAMKKKAVNVSST